MELPKNLPKTIVLLVLDGFGVAPKSRGNAISLSKTPVLDRLFKNYPHAKISASGNEVGLDMGEDGNSEVGHMTMGAGRVILQLSSRIDESINSGNFYKNEELLKALEYAKTNDSHVHLLGLIGGGVVHASLEHAKALITLCKREKVNPNRVFFHVITDGRDSEPKSALTYIHELEHHMHKERVGNISTIIGRHYAMDRDERWERTLKAYDLYTKAEGKEFETWEEAVEHNYDSGVVDDQYIEPSVILNYDSPFPAIDKKDVVIFFNYRADRAIQISSVFQDSKLQKQLSRETIPKLYFLGFAKYSNHIPKHTAFGKESIVDTLGATLSKHRKYQLRIAESEKFPHVTYFFNGGRDELFAGEDRVEIPSNKKVKTYDKAPHMKVKEITEEMIKRLEKEKYSFILANFANADMVSHTGDIDATIAAIEYMDGMIGKLVKIVEANDYILVITADHGNAEEMFVDGHLDTKHSNNPVPFVIIGKNIGKSYRLKPAGSLADVAPTILNLLGIEKPDSMTGENLIE
ncbi:2,3-bisphosphoglycerate-independent phosphoglycerate mutase [Candidatus Dojkabacteria bacterium]|uniref:2,3-bisphosphoglycerate-independent phosphoglycerate mutase n=1 Tax=Candidatus Dojkabacteria bacterium TaxID=2099670 RepID=A0A955L847_9BACT|nr:2,3-bisphosphoglycerate-independent phosphoglycerate mutase [Candidatus Dojkabacteria bacterium]